MSRYVVHRALGLWFVLDTIDEAKEGECKVAGSRGAWEVHTNKREAHEAAKRLNNGSE